MTNEATAQTILKEIQYATIATITPGGEPWNTPVFCATDAYTIYWSSHPDSIHSKNITANGKAFITIYDSKAGEGEGIGLYIQARVTVLGDTEEIRYALDLLGKRRGKPFLHLEKFKDDGPQRIYKAMPLKVWTNDAHQDADGDFIKDFRVEVTPWSKHGFNRLSVI